MSKTDNATERGGFWTSIPGILTAVATLVTAVFGAYVGHQQLKKDDRPPQEQVVQQTPASTPPTGDTYNILIEDPSGLQEAVDADLASAGPVEGCASGNAADCQDVLDTLEEGCRVGIWDACNVLYEVMPAGSYYEEYGGTCGYRDDGRYAGMCGVGYG